MQEDVRYRQRFSNYKSALKHLYDAVELSRSRELSYLEKQGFIQAFEFTFELAWKALKDFLEYKGSGEKIYGSRDAIIMASEKEIITHPHVWLKMIRSRNMTSYIYDETVIDEIVEVVCKSYIGRFLELQRTMEEIG